MKYQGKHYRKVTSSSSAPKENKKKEKPKVQQYLIRMERQIHKEVEGEFSRLGVSPRTIQEVVEMQQPSLELVPLKKVKKPVSKRKRQYVKK